MNDIDQDIHALLSAEEADATPDVAAAMIGINRGIARRRHRRVATAGAAAVAVAAVAVAVPTTMQHRAARHAVPPGATASTKPVPFNTSTLAPTWMPAGLVETGRSLFLLGGDTPTWGTTRTWSKTPGTIPFVEVTDQPAKEPVLPQAGTPMPVTIAGHSGQAWADHSRGRDDYVIIVHWSAGHWLSVDVRGLPDMPATALRVANSIVEKATTVSAPVSCSVCTDMIVNVSGTRSGWSGDAMPGDGMDFTFDRNPVQTGAVTVPLAGGMFAHLSADTNPAIKDQLAAVAKTVRSTNPDYSWMGTRP